MKETPRLVLWASDSPRNAVDSICETIKIEINANLKDAVEDSSFVNQVVAYVRCLTGVYDWAGGAYVEYETVEDWRNKVLTAIGSMPNNSHYNDAERTQDKMFVNEVFDDLRSIVKRMYDE